MSNYSERKLQQALHQAGFYTQKAPSSGHGILDEETEEYIDQADILAVRGEHRTEEDYYGHLVDITVPQVLIIEEKHRKPPACRILDEELHQVKRIQEITGGEAWFAVSWKNKHGGHHFHRWDQVKDTGKHFKITEDMPSRGIDDV